MKSAIWFVTWQCMLKCPYCWQRNGIPPDVIKQTQPEQLPLWTTWLRFLRAFDLDILDLSGGEPFLLPGLDRLVLELPKQTKIGITTNAVERESVLRLAFASTNERIISWTLSWHPSADVRDFWATVNLLRSRDYHVTVNHVLYPGQVLQWEECKRNCDKLGAMYHADPYSVPQGAQPPVYTEVELRTIEMLVKPDRRRLTGKGHCDAGLRHYVFTPDMRVFPCIRGLFEGWPVSDNGIDCDDFSKCAGCDRDKLFS